MNAVEAIVRCKCPRCRKGEMFATKFHFFKPSHMNVNCPVCDFRFEIELGFYWAALYVSYALNIAESVTLALAISILTGSANPWIYSGVLVSAILLLVSFNIRYSRVLLLYMAGEVTYQPELGNTNN